MGLGSSIASHRQFAIRYAVMQHGSPISHQS
jgi:hypothetical protein